MALGANTTSLSSITFCRDTPLSLLRVCEATPQLLEPLQLGKLCRGAN